MSLHPSLEPLPGWDGAIPLDREPDGHWIVDLDPLTDPMLLWSGKASARPVGGLPLQRTEIVPASQLGRIARRALGPDRENRVEWFEHADGWRNRLISGDSLPVMEALMRHERMAGAVQAVYMDPPYGIKYDANFQQRVDRARNDADESSDDVLTIKAFRDTWVLGIHSYLSYLQERLYLARELLTPSGSIFVQSGDRNVHLVRNVLDEVFGARNFVAIIPFRKKTMPLGARYLDGMVDFLVWYAKDLDSLKYRQLYLEQDIQGEFHWKAYETSDGQTCRMTPEQQSDHRLLPAGARPFRMVSMKAPGYSAANDFEIELGGTRYPPPRGGSWITGPEGIARLKAAGRLALDGRTVSFKLFFDDFPLAKLTNLWSDTVGAFDKAYVVQTSEEVVRRCLLMSTDPGDLVLDPTCGSGTTAMCAERWGRRWIACDTSRVAIHVARRRLLGAAFDPFVLRGSTPADGFALRAIERRTLRTIAGGLEPERIELVDRPAVKKGVVRVTGPFELDAVGRYAEADWHASVQTGEGLENYVEVLCRLYAPDARTEVFGLVHAVFETDGRMSALSVGPLAGRVTASQVEDAVQDARMLGISEVHVLGWAFDANLGATIDRLSTDGADSGTAVRLVAIRPDALARGLKPDARDRLFAPQGTPEVELEELPDGRLQVRLLGVSVPDRQTGETVAHAVGSGYIAAWYLDEAFDGDCFVDSQIFLDLSRTPNLRALLKVDVDPEEFQLQAFSRPFQRPVTGRVAVKTTDVYGNESTVVLPAAG